MVGHLALNCSGLEDACPTLGKDIGTWALELLSPSWTNRARFWLLFNSMLFSSGESGG